MIELCIFLGNPGMEYARSRHNVAWHFEEYVHRDVRHKLTRKYQARYGKIERSGRLLNVLLPETYMNLSGKAVAMCMDALSLGLPEILVIHDEIELPFGTIACKAGGGTSGHRGLKSIVASLGSGDFGRIRIGVGKPGHEDIAGYVLSDFSARERADLEGKVFPLAATAYDACLSLGMSVAADKFRKVSVPETDFYA